MTRCAFLDASTEPNPEGITGWGIAGTGGVATAFAQALRDVPGSELVCAGSRTPSKAERFMQANSSRRLDAGSYESLMTHPNVDIVYIATPASHHYRHTLMALNAGKHVLVEKPFAVNVEQARNMAAFAQSQGLFLMEAMWPRFLPSATQLRALLASKRVGEVRMVEAAFGARGEYRPEQRAFRMDLAGGTLMDVTVYPIQFAHMVFGAPDTVTALARCEATGIDTEDVVTMRWPDGRLAVAKGATRTTLDSSARIYGTDGMIVVPGAFMNPPWIEVHWPDQEPLHIDCPPLLDRLAYQAIAVHKCLAEGFTEAPLMPLGESVAVMRTMDAVRDQIGLRFPPEVEAT